MTAQGLGPIGDIPIVGPLAEGALGAAGVLENPGYDQLIAEMQKAGAKYDAYRPQAWQGRMGALQSTMGLFEPARAQLEHMYGRPVASPGGSVGGLFQPQMPTAGAAGAAAGGQPGVADQSGLTNSLIANSLSPEDYQRWLEANKHMDPAERAIRYQNEHGGFGGFQVNEGTTGSTPDTLKVDASKPQPGAQPTSQGTPRKRVQARRY